MKKAIGTVHEKSGKNSVAVFFDMLGCMIKYGAGYNDYVIFEFYNMKAENRKTYMTRFKNKKFVMRFNNQEYSYIFDQKNVFDSHFKEYLGREVHDIVNLNYEKFAEFVKDKEFIIAKPYVGESGKGIEKLRKSDFADTRAFYDYVTDKSRNFGVVEEIIKQHPVLDEIYPCSLNCLRVVTLVVDGTPHILYSVFKTGNNGNFVDNLENGGLACHFDLDRGVITGPGHSSKLELFERHPYTGVKFDGFKLPYCEEVKKMVKEAALKIPEFKYCGWDVCFTENGPAIVEGNDYPAYDFPQLPEADKPRIGFLATVQKYVPDFK